MLKAVFIDYMGTTVQESSPEMAELVMRICKNSDLHDPKQVQHLILRIRRQYEALRINGCTPDEVIHIGDFYSSDVVGARSAGIRPLLLLRGQQKHSDDVDTANNLEDALKLIKAALDTVLQNS